MIKLLQNSTRGSLENADRLAAMNYQQGDYASAKVFLEHAGDGGLAWWLQAKLAVREGDKTAAAAAYASWPRPSRRMNPGASDGPGLRVRNAAA